MKHEVERTLITPEYAKELIDASHFDELFKQRNVNKNTVAQYAEMMIKGEWLDLTNDCMMIDAEQRIINGQHRLLACIKSGRSFETYLIRNADSEMIHFTDKGRGRSVSDDLIVNGYRNTTNLSSTLKLLYNLNANNGVVAYSTDKFQYYKARDTLAAYPNVEEVSSICKSKSYTCSGISYPIAGFIVSAVKDQYVNKAWEFVEKLKTGQELNFKSPVLALRNLSMGWNKASRKTPNYATRLIIATRAWNLFATDEEVSYLKIDTKPQRLFGANLKPELVQQIGVEP